MSSITNQQNVPITGGMHTLYEGYKPEDTGTAPDRILDSLLRSLARLSDLRDELDALLVHARDSGFQKNLEAKQRLLATAERMRVELYSAACRIEPHV